MRNGDRFGYYLVLLLMACSVALGGCSREDSAVAQETVSGEVPLNVRVLRVGTSNVEEFFSISGPLRPLRGSDLSVEESGRIESIPGDKGSRVKMGQVLLMQDRSLLEAEMQAAQAASDLSQFNYERLQTLYKEKAVSEIELLEAKSAYGQASAQARAAKIRYDRAAMKAPYDGIVSNRFVELGQLVTAGTPAMRLVNPYVLKLMGSVTERDIALVSEGKHAWLEFEDRNSSVQGVVHWVGPEADPLTGKFPVEIRVENSDLRIHAGVIGRASVLKSIHEGVISIPRDAIVLHTGKPEAYVVENNRAVLRQLRLGSDQGLMVIVESGLKVGDRLIVRGQRNVTDGALVMIQQEADAADGSMIGDPGLSGAAEVGR